MLIKLILRNLVNEGLLSEVECHAIISGLKELAEHTKADMFDRYGDEVIKTAQRLVKD